VLGFNLGIEVMQIFVISLTIPWFIIMSRTHYFKLAGFSSWLITGLCILSLTLFGLTKFRQYLRESP
jgi:hypothetical protein